MANLLALDWDGREARVAVARRRGADIVLEQAFAVPLETGGANRSMADDLTADADVAQRLTAALSARQIGRCDTLVAVGRSRIELRSLALPPSPMEELPDLVRFQSLRQFAAIGEDWPIDFVHLNTGDEESLNVLAAAISPEMVAQIRGICESAGQTAKHLVLRPFAASSLLLRNMRDNDCRLMVDLLADEADLTVIADRQLVFMRTVRLPDTDDSQRKYTSLLGEIRRTMVAAQNQLGGRAVERIVLCGGQQEHAELQTRVAEALSLPIDVFDPLSAVELSSRLKGELPPNPGRYAPLLGMLLDEASGAAHAIDFLHPRKRPKPKSRKRTFALAGAGLAAILLLAGGKTYLDFRQLDADTLALQQEAKELEAHEKIANELVANAKALDAWNGDDVIWLDELRNLSRKYPTADQAVVTQFRADVLPRIHGGRYIIDCAAAEPQTITDIERLLRDSRRNVYSGGGASSESVPGYRWGFEETVIIAPRTEEDSAAAPSNATPPKNTSVLKNTTTETPPSRSETNDAAETNEAAGTNEAAETSSEPLADPPNQEASTPSDDQPEAGDRS